MPRASATPPHKVVTIDSRRRDPPRRLRPFNPLGRLLFVAMSSNVTAPASGPDVPCTSKPRQRLVWIEVARGIAATLVVLHHVSRHLEQEYGARQLGGVLDPGNAAVDFFFVLSGFLIFHVTRRDVGNPARLGIYVKKRVLRIYPIFWMAMLAFSALHLVSAHTEVTFEPMAVLREAALWPPSDGDHVIVGVGWSLKFEIAFYMLFASFIVNRSLGRVVFSLWAAAALLRTAGVIEEPTNPVLLLLTRSWVLLFPAGMLVGLLVRREKHPPSGLIVVLGIGLVSMAWYAQCRGDLEGDSLAARAIYGAASTVLLYGLILRDLQGRTTSWRPLLILGECSYSIYLFHMVGVAFAAKAISSLDLYGRVPVVVLAALMILGGMAAGLAAGLIVERRLVAWSRRMV